MGSEQIDVPFSFEQLASFLLKSPYITMVWGDVGVGKSTFALQIARIVVKSHKKKVFYLNTKETSNFSIISRIFEIPISESSTSQGDEIPFFCFQKNTVQQQFECISQWLLQIQQHFRLFNEISVGLIIVDEIFSNYLIELRKEQTNEKLNRKMALILATLRQLAAKFNIPILLINTFSIKEHPETKQLVATPHGGKILNFWVDAELKVTRSSLLQVINFKVIKAPFSTFVPLNWKWKLNETGFI